jgi:3-methyladenine DNA glycosylase AlkD
VFLVTITPQQLSAKAAARLQALGNPVSAQGVKRFFKPHEKIRAYGLSTPQLRKLTSEILKEIKGQWTLSETIEFCEMQLASDFMESKHLGIFLLARFRKQFQPSLLTYAHKWLYSNLCANWAATDALCSMVISPLLESHPNLAPSLLKWSRSKNLWVRRASAASLVSLARKGQHLDLAYQIAEQLFLDNEDLIHKATGWLLREAGKTDAARLEGFLLQHGARIPRTALRYAIEKFSEQKRKQILKQTKAPF